MYKYTVLDVFELVPIIKVCIHCCSLKTYENYRDTTSKLPQWGFLMSLRSLKSNEITTQPHTSSVATVAASTIDAADVEFFSKQLNEWWDPDGKMALLHRMNVIR